MRWYWNIRERVKLFQYNTRSFSLQVLKRMSVISSIIGVGLMIYYHGFELSADHKVNLLLLLKGLFLYYFFSYGVRLLYSTSFFVFLKENWLESVMLSISILDIGLYFAYDIQCIKYLFVQMGFGQDGDLYGFILQLYLFVLIFFELGKAEINFSSKKVNPAIIFIFIFGGLILIGAGLLMLPEMTRPLLLNGQMVSESMDFIDALFTSASAACVTGLMVEDTMSFFTLKGQLVILLLIKVGGLNIVAFGLFFAVFSRFGLRVRQHDIIEDIVNKVTFNSAKGFFGKILFVSLMIEAIGAFLLFFLLPESPEIQSISMRLHYAIFHAISAFNNAGISLYEGGFANEVVSNNFPVLAVMSAIIFIGTLGFITILDLISIKDLRERIDKPWKKLDIGTRVGLLSNTHLLVVGTFFFLILEWGSSDMVSQNFIEKTITSLFQVVNRTAGFNSVDMSSVGLPMVMILIILMFIGGSSSSTAGGVKTSTTTLIFVSIYATITGKKNGELFGKSIPKALLLKAYVVVLFFFVYIFLWTFLLTITESKALSSGSMTFVDMVFEEISAFSTVGLSLGVTTQFSVAGKFILIVSMFIGRLGTLMLLMALSKQVKSTKYKYPDAHLMIG